VSAATLVPQKFFTLSKKNLQQKASCKNKLKTTGDEASRSDMGTKNSITTIRDGVERPDPRIKSHGKS
jgi:hypothetical protein